MPMDSVSHTTVAHYLLDYVEKTDDISFNRKAFMFGNLKPDLKGEYLTKRHYPSLMFDEVMQRIRDFIQNVRLNQYNGPRVSEELGVICHYLTDFFTFPHNDDIYSGSLLAHYIYEKQEGLTIRWRINEKRFDGWAHEAPKALPHTPDALVQYITEQHRCYVAQEAHDISDDIAHICRVVTAAVRAIIAMTCEVVSTVGQQKMVQTA